ncbi:hypothetical protein AZE42_00255 [Rhizopogon vesiculosus]|uniref:Uncharacterized protein n=1 Tax=Rhizopogon vesiculosus TaxID=180088 RepID=A0A1J8PSV3_9AGAM|nr:hypothetical protein AZE42_00255 [Rhizopogon vesiculosus]
MALDLCFVICYEDILADCQIVQQNRQPFWRPTYEAGAVFYKYISLRNVLEVDHCLACLASLYLRNVLDASLQCSSLSPHNFKQTHSQGQLCRRQGIAISTPVISNAFDQIRLNASSPDCRLDSFVYAQGHRLLFEMRSIYPGSIFNFGRVTSSQTCAIALKCSPHTSAVAHSGIPLPHCNSEAA